MNVKPVIIKTTTRNHEIIPLPGFIDDKNEYIYVRYISVKSAEDNGLPIEYLNGEEKERTNMKGKTNYEVIHSMGTEQLAEFLACFWSRDMVPKRYDCDMIHPCLGCPENYICFREWLERPCTDAMFKEEDNE